MGFQLLIFGIWLLMGFHSSPNQLKKSEEIVQGNLLRHTPPNKHTQNQTKTPIQHDILELSNVDYVLSNAKSSLFGAMLSKVMDIIARLTGCAGQAADAVSVLYPRHLDSSTHDTNGQNHGPVWKVPCRSSWAKSVRSSFGRTVMERQFEKILLQHGWEKVSNWECLFVHREKGLFLSVYVVEIGWKKKNLDPMLKLLNKEVDLEN